MVSVSAGAQRKKEERNHAGTEGGGEHSQRMMADGMYEICGCGGGGGWSGGA